MVAGRRRWRRAVRWNDRPAPKTTSPAAAAANHRQPSNRSGETMETAATGRVRAAATTNRRCNSVVRRCWTSSASAVSGASYPAPVTAARRSATPTAGRCQTTARPAAKFTLASSTPSKSVSAAATRPAQAAHDMPATARSLRTAGPAATSPGAFLTGSAYC